MSKHTPGPWAYDPSYGQVLAPRDERNRWEICMIGLRETFCPKGDEREDNAKLIAAAPDLLEACKAALDFMESGSGDLDEHQRHASKVRDQLNDAVVAAEKEKP